MFGAPFIGHPARRVLQSTVLSRCGAAAIVPAEARVPTIRLYRTILPTNDIDREAQFYRALLEQDGVRISPGRHYFGVGGVILAIVSPMADSDDEQPRPNFDHVYFA